MKLSSLLAATAATLIAGGAANARHSHNHGDVGHVVFANSCAPAVQDELTVRRCHPTTIQLRHAANDRGVEAGECGA